MNFINEHYSYLHPSVYLLSPHILKYSPISWWIL